MKQCNPNSVFMCTNYKEDPASASLATKTAAQMRGPTLPAIDFLSTKRPEIIAHLCAVFPTGMSKSPPHTFPNWKNYETNLRPLIM